MAEGHPGKLIVRPIPISSEAISRAIARKFGCDIMPLTAPPKKQPIQPVFDSLTPVEREFVAKFLIIDVNQLDLIQFEKFMDMPPGMREFRMKLQVTECWKSSDWKDAIPEARECVRSISEKCGFVPATPDEMLQAVATGMSQTQRNIIDQFFMQPMYGFEPLTPEFQALPNNDYVAKLEIFDAWLRGHDLVSLQWNRLYPSTHEMKKLSRKLAQNLGFDETDRQTLAWVKKLAGTDSMDQATVIDAFNKINQLHNAVYNLWFNTPQHERSGFWRHNMLDLCTAVGLAHKIRFVKNYSLSREENGLARILTEADDVTTTYSRGMQGLGNRLGNSFLRGNAKLDGDNRKKLINAFTTAVHYEAYNQPIIHLAAFDGQMRAEGLLAAAYAQAQFDVLRSALGFATNLPQAKITYEHSDMRAKRDRAGNPQKCEDNFSSAEVHLPDGTIINLHAVFDGMGGHEGGEIASGIAKNIFEISAMAGWMTTPEEVRRTIVMADIAIIMEQIVTKSSDDLCPVEHPMGSTMSVTLQLGREFYGIHCGDSDWKIIRDGKVILRSVGHSYAYSLGYSSALKGLNGRDLDSLTQSELSAFFAKVAEETERHEPISESLGRNHVIVSAVGGMTNYITINNMDSDALPFILEDGDHIVLNSDGIGVPVCDHEFALFLDLYHGDLKQVREALISTAEARRADNRNGPPDADGKPTAITEFDPTCGCPLRKGKRDDDKVVTIDKVELPAS